MATQPFIVTLSEPADTFRRVLRATLPAAVVLRELPRHQVVVLVPAELAGQLQHVPGVTGVVPDELAQKLRPGRQGGT